MSSQPEPFVMKDYQPKHAQTTKMKPKNFIHTIFAKHADRLLA